MNGTGENKVCKLKNSFALLLYILFYKLVGFDTLLVNNKLALLCYYFLTTYTINSTNSLAQVRCSAFQVTV